jgi:hypothetical protein
LYTLLKPKQEKVVAAHHVVLPPEGPPPADPAATFAAHLPQADWGATAWPVEGPEGPAGNPADGTANPEKPS